MSMNKICPICSKQFDTHDKRKVYCNIKCAKRARNKSNAMRNAGYNAEKRRQWAQSEAERVAEIAITTGGSCIDRLADYIYNSYNKRSK